MVIRLLSSEDQKGDLVQTYLIQFVKEAPALKRLEVVVEGKKLPLKIKY